MSGGEKKFWLGRKMEEEPDEETLRERQMLDEMRKKRLRK